MKYTNFLVVFEADLTKDVVQAFSAAQAAILAQAAAIRDGRSIDICYVRNLETNEEYEIQNTAATSVV